MGAPQARVQLTGDCLDIEWPALASCTGLRARCWLRDGTVHESSRWTAVPAAANRFRTRCGPLDVEVELMPARGCARLRVEVATTAEVDVARVAVAADARRAGGDLTWVLANGYQSWDLSGHVPAAGGTRESWWTVALAGGPGVAAPPTVGWVSWYHLGPWVTRDDVLAHADLLAAEPFRGLGYRLVQVDDGWQETYGEWRPNTKFPGGLAPLSAELGRRGQVAGLWLAPFLVSVAADLDRDAPDDWFVIDPATGERAVDERHRVFGPMHVLDASRPGVRAYLHDLFAGLASAGIRYFKVDFLYAGAFAGLGALRAGM